MPYTEASHLLVTRRPEASRFIGGNRSLKTHKQIMALQKIRPRLRIEVDSPSPHGALLTRLQSDIASCRLCSSLDPWRQFESDAYGTPCTGYLLVGEAPGYKSWEQRRRFTGPAGMLIRRALRQVGHPRYRNLEDLFYITDVLKCHPAADSQSTSNRSPRRAEIQSCVNHLIREVRLLQPSIIVTFGKIAAEAVTTIEPSSKVIAFPHPSPRNQLTIRKHYASMKAFEDAISNTFCELITQLEQRSCHA